MLELTKRQADPSGASAQAEAVAARGAGVGVGLDIGLGGRGQHHTTVTDTTIAAQGETDTTISAEGETDTTTHRHHHTTTIAAQGETDTTVAAQGETDAACGATDTTIAAQGETDTTVADTTISADGDADADCGTSMDVEDRAAAVSKPSRVLSINFPGPRPDNTKTCCFSLRTYVSKWCTGVPNLASMIVPGANMTVIQHLPRLSTLTDCAESNCQVFASSASHPAASSLALYLIALVSLSLLF